MIVIGLHGPMRSGKDTASNIVHEWAQERGVFAVRRGFADLLKLSAARLFFPDIEMEAAIAWANEFKFDGSVSSYKITGVGDALIYNEKASLTGRQLLQRWGTETHRDVFDPDFWVNQILPHDEMARIRAVMKHSGSRKYPEIVTIPDVRFENEARRIISIPEGQVWRIVRPELDLSDGHISEAILPDELCTAVLDNHKDLAEFRLHVRALCEQLPVGDLR